MLCTYTGNDSRYYMAYKDAATGRMLEVSPGGQYDVEVASGQAAGLPVPPGDGRWTVTVVREGAFEVPASRAPAPPVLAAKPAPAAPVTSKEAGGSPAEEES